MFVCGYNKYFQLGEESSLKNSEGYPIIFPPQNSHIKMSTLLSISTYYAHTVFITQEFEAYAIGDNNCKISPKLPLDIIKENQIIIKDENGQPFKFTSAVCGNDYTLYLVKNEKNMEESRLIFASDHHPLIFVNMCGRTAISLFGGKSAAVVIDKEGSIILLTKNNLTNDDKDVDAKKLYKGMMPVDVAILRDTIYVVDSKGHLYYSRISQGKLNTFNYVTELQGELIVSVSGKSNHCFAITVDGRVFGYGGNNKCKLGLPSSKTRCDKFTEITSLNEYKIVSAFAGENHSFFKTSTGKILVCGNN